MRVMKIDEMPAEKRSGGIFLGTVESKPLVNESIGAKDLKLDIITFTAGQAPKRATNVPKKRRRKMIGVLS
jgi:hypothetical protein